MSNIDATILVQQLNKDQKNLYTIKTPEEIEKMRIAGNIAAQILEILNNHVKHGVTTRELDAITYDLITNRFNAETDRTDLEGHDANSSQCIYYNHNEIIARGEINDNKLKNGDIFGIDLSLKKDGYCADTQKMWVVGGNTSPLAMKLMAVAYQAMWVGIKMIKPGVFLGSISYAVENYIKSQGFTPVAQTGLSAHSIGKVHCEGLLLPFYGELPNTGHVLQKGMVITIEPFICAGNGLANIIPNSTYTAITKDKSLSAMFEHVVAVTDDGYDVLDLRPGESNLME